MEGARVVLEESTRDEGSDLRRRLGRGCRRSGAARGRRPAGAVDRYAQDAAGYLVTSYRRRGGPVISETIERWDGREASRRIELHVGRDLQFIRINGTVVGGLVGVLIHAVTLLAG